jgi:hypothetical protein
LRLRYVRPALRIPLALQGAQILKRAHSNSPQMVTMDLQRAHWSAALTALHIAHHTPHSQPKLIKHAPAIT